MPSNRTSIADFAAEHDIAPRRVRRTTRSMGLGVGKGKKYGLTVKQVEKLTDKLGLTPEPVEEPVAAE